MRSGERVKALLYSFLQGRGCAIDLISAKRGTLRVFRRCNTGLIIVSVNLPKISNCSIYSGVERASGTRVVVTATESSGRDALGNLRVNTSSCVYGPCSVSVLVTGVGNVFGQGCTLSRVMYSGLGLGGIARALAIGRAPIGIARGRFRLLGLLIRGGKAALGGRCLFGHV